MSRKSEPVETVKELRVQIDRGSAWVNGFVCTFNAHMSEQELHAHSAGRRECRISPFSSPTLIDSWRLGLMSSVLTQREEAIEDAGTCEYFAVICDTSGEETEMFDVVKEAWEKGFFDGRLGVKDVVDKRLGIPDKDRWLDEFYDRGYAAGTDFALRLTHSISS